MLLVFVVIVLPHHKTSAKGYINNNGVVQRIDNDNEDIILPAPEELNGEDEDDSDQCSGDHDHHDHSDHHVHLSKKKKSNDMKGYEKWNDHFAKQRPAQSRVPSPKKSVAAKLLDKFSRPVLSDRQSKRDTNNNKQANEYGKHGLQGPPTSSMFSGNWFGVGGGVGGNRRGSGDFFGMRSSSRRRPTFTSADPVFFDDLPDHNFQERHAGSRDYHDYVAHQKLSHSFRQYPRSFSRNRLQGLAYDEEGSIDGEMETSQSLPYRSFRDRGSRFLRRQPQFDDYGLEDGSMIPEESLISRGNKGWMGSRRRGQSNAFYSDPEMDGLTPDNNDDGEEIKEQMASSSSPQRKRFVDRIRQRLLWRLRP